MIGGAVGSAFHTGVIPTTQEILDKLSISPQNQPADTKKATAPPPPNVTTWFAQTEEGLQWYGLNGGSTVWQFDSQAARDNWTSQTNGSIYARLPFARNVVAAWHINPDGSRTDDQFAQIQPIVLPVL